jgi:hypothetical protein
MRALTARLRRALTAQETDELLLQLLTFEHETLPAPLRFVNDLQNHESRGETYYGCPFKLALPDDRDDTPPSCKIEVDNVHHEIVESVRRMILPLEVTLELVLAAEPDIVEMGPLNFTMRGVTYNALTVEGVLWYEDVLNEPFPSGRKGPGGASGLFDPPRFPGLF